jgi:hypothetical protein
MKTRKENKHFIFSMSFDHPLKKDLKYYIKRILLPFLDCFYELCIYLKHPESKKKEYYFSICAIFKNEALILKEWIEYHLIVGVEHFYLYNNFSDDNYQEILRPYIEKGIVDLIDWPVQYGQFSCYEDFWQKYRNQTQWVSFTDLDEFFCPVQELTVSNWLRKYEKYPSVLIYWKIFGTSGRVDHDYTKLVTEQYIMSWDKMDTCGKVIINTDWQYNKIYHHLIDAKISIIGKKILIPPVNEFGKFIKWDDVHRTKFRMTNDNFTLQLNHYWSKAYKPYCEKKSRGAVAGDFFSYTMDLFWWHEHYNRSVDHKIFRFLVQLKLAM